MLSLIPISKASTPAFDYIIYESNAKCWSGYDGNSTIYMVKGISDSNLTGVNYTRAAQIVGSENVSGYQTTENNTYGTPNILYLTDGGNSQTEEYLTSDGSLYVNLSLAFLGAYRNSSRSDYVVNNVELSVLASSPSWEATNNHATLEYVCNSGFNTTGPIDISSGNYQKTLVTLGLSGLGVLASIADLPEVGIVVSAAGGAYAICGSATGYSSSINSQIKDGGTLYEYFGVTCGGPVNPGSNSYNGNVFGAGVPVNLYIQPAQFDSPITYTIYANSTMGQHWPVQCQYQNCGPATHVSMTVSAVPAVEISGTAYLGPGNQHPDANNYVYLQVGLGGQNYKVPTNSAGDFRFFGAPNTNYTIHATYDTPANGTGAYHPELSENSVTVNTGSPGTLVYAGIHVGGAVEGYVTDYTGQPIDNASVSIQNSAGNVEYVHTNSQGFYFGSVGNNSSYIVTASAGGNTSSNTVTATYLQTTYDNLTLGLFGVTFSESGLPTGAQWSVDLGGSQASSTGSSLVIAKPDGQYSYTIGASTDSGLQYNPSPSSGSVTVSGSGVSVSTSFAPVSISFDETGLHGNTWSVTIGKLTESTSGTSLSLAKPINSDYYYTIGVPEGYSANPSSGTTYLGSSSTSVSVSFTPTSYYSVTFDESGLPSGYTWSVNMGGTAKSASTGSSIGFSEPDGYFSYSPSSLFVPEPGKPGYYYDYHASGGTAYVNGASQTIDIRYSYIIVHYCVNASTEILLANGSYEQAQYIHAGDEIMTYNITTGSLQTEIVQQVLSVNETSQYTINGNLQVSGDQPILTDHGWIDASYLHVGDRIFDPLNGTYEKITSIDHSQGSFTMYDFLILGNNDFVADAYLLHGTLN